jgi:hypothetical protein
MHSGMQMPIESAERYIALKDNGMGVPFSREFTDISTVPADGD